MNHRHLLAIVVWSLPFAAHGADWEAMSHTPAQIEVVNMKATPLVEGGDKSGWAKVPPALTKRGATIYMPSDKHDGVADFKVLADGYLLLACNYENQGNRGGNWAEEIWDEKKFKSKGWHELSKHEFEGELVKGDNRLQIVFSRQVHKGESFRLRCNKYDPSFPIMLGAAAGVGKQ